MRKIVYLITFLFTTLSFTAYAAQPSKNPPRKPITEQMIQKRNATVIYMDDNYKIAMANLEKSYKDILAAKSNTKVSSDIQLRLSNDKITNIYTYYKDKINMAYENDKKYILLYYGE